MKRSPDLITEILRALEKDESAWGTQPRSVTDPVTGEAAGEERTGYHASLCEQAGYIRRAHGGQGQLAQLTWKGHEHLASERAKNAKPKASDGDPTEVLQHLPEWLRATAYPPRQGGRLERLLTGARTIVIAVRTAAGREGGNKPRVVIKAKPSQLSELVPETFFQLQRDVTLARAVGEDPAFMGEILQVSHDEKAGTALATIRWWRRPRTEEERESGWVHADRPALENARGTSPA